MGEDTLWLEVATRAGLRTIASQIRSAACAEVSAGKKSKSSVGAAMGALAGHYSNYGIDKEFIERARSKVTEGTSALFLMTSQAVQDKVTDAVKKSGLKFDIFYTNLSAEQEKQLKEDFAS